MAKELLTNGQLYSIVWMLLYSVSAQCELCYLLQCSARLFYTETVISK